MNILLIHRYYAPDTPPYAWMLQSIARRLVKDGHAVTVLTSQPSYNRAAGIPKQPRLHTEQGVTVKRVALFPETKKNFLARGVNLLLFMLRVFAHILRRRDYDVVMAATTPPVFVAMTARIAAGLSGARFVYHCQDLHPELTLHSGLLKEGWFYRLLKRIDSATVTAASRVVVLSEDMANTLRTRLNDNLEHIRVINNFIQPQKADVVASENDYKSARFRVLFAGNLGYFQGLEVVVDAAHLLDNPEIEIVFLGDGAAKAQLIAQAAEALDKRVHFWGHKPQAVAEQIIHQADVCLICLGQGIIKTAFPSKTITYLAQGRPLLVVVEPDSELAHLVTSNAIGKVSAPGDAPALAANIQAMYDLRPELPAMQQRAQALATQLFERETRLDDWSALMADLQTQPDNTTRSVGAQ